MRKELEKLIQVASLPNNQLKTVKKSRQKLLDDMKEAIYLIHELIHVNEQIEHKPNKFDEQLCNQSEELYQRLNHLSVYKTSYLLTDLLAHPDHELVVMADDLIDLIDESRDKIIAKINPLKGREYSSIPS